MDPHSRAPKKNTSHGNEMLPQDTTLLIQRPTRKSVTRSSRQSAAVGPHEDFLTIVKRCKVRWYGHISRSSGLVKTMLQGTVKGMKKTRQTEEEMGRQHQGMDRSGVQQVPESGRGQRKNGRHWLRSHLRCPKKKKRSVKGQLKAKIVGS